MIVSSMAVASRWRLEATVKAASIANKFTSSKSELEVCIQGFRYLQDNEITKLSWLLDEVALMYKIEESRVPSVAYTVLINRREVLLDLFARCWLRVHLLGDPRLAVDIERITAATVIAEEATLGEKIQISTDGGEGAEVRMVLLGGLIEISFSVISENNAMYGDTSLMALALEGLFRYLRRMCDDLRTTTEGGGGEDKSWNKIP